MFACYVCSAYSDTVEKLHLHLQRHECAGELTFPIHCMQENCTSTFHSVWNLRRHLNTFHKLSKSARICSDALADFSGSEEIDRPTCDSVLPEKRPKYSVADVQQQGISLVASLRSNSAVPCNVVSHVVQSFNHISHTAVSYLKQEILEPLQAVPGLSPTLLSQIEDSLQNMETPLDFLSTRYKQDSYFLQHPLFVAPETISLGTRYEWHHGENRLVYNTYEYVSIEKNLRSLLHNKDFVELLLAESPGDPDVLSTYSDGERCKQHSLFNDSSKFSLKIQLFYDGLGTANPLRAQSSTCNVGVFYYTLQNIPPSHNSCFANVHLLAICYSLDLKTYGYCPVLERFVAEMQKLQSCGFSGDFPLIGSRQVYAGLAQVCCDNLALNGLFGFIECFSADYFCTICYATQADIQRKTYEHEFQLRSIAEYENDVACVAQKPCGSHSHGVKSPCLLNNLPDFHVTQNFVLDPMHLTLEGIVPYELGCILYELVHTKSLLTLTQLNNSMRHLFDRNTVDKNKRPPMIGHIEKPGCGLSPSMKAVQMFAFLRYLPLAIGKFVNSGDPHWLLLLHLCELVDLLFAPRFTVGMVAFLREFISEHLMEFKRLFGHQVNLRPKQHLMVHVPSVILKNGPLSTVSCLRYELKNSFFKRSAGIVCNFINICKTLSYRHQCFAFYSRCSKDYLRMVVTAGSRSSECKAVTDYDFCQCVCEKIDIDPSQQIIVASYIHLASVAYKKGHFVVTGIGEDGNLVFGRVQAFVSMLDSRDWYAVVSKFVTDFFSTHYHVYQVHRMSPVAFACISVQSLIDHNPLYGYMLDTVTETALIRLPYHITA